MQPTAKHCVYLICLAIHVWMQSDVQAQQLLHTHNKIYPATSLLAIDSQLAWKFGNATGDKTLPSTEIVRWGAWVGVTRNAAVWLNDGSWLVGELDSITPESVSVRSDWLDEVTIPLRNVRGIVKVAPASLAVWNQLQRQMETTTGSRDNVWLAGGRQVSGILRIDPSDGSTADSYGIENAGEQTRVAWSDTQAIAFSPALLGPLPAQSNHLVVGLTDGSRLNVRSVQIDDTRLKFQLVGGVEVQSLDQPNDFVAGVNLLANRPTNVTFLADLEPANYRNISHTRIPWPLGKNRDLLGRPLMNAIGVIDRGLSMHSSSQAAYRWDGSAARLLSEVLLAAPPNSVSSDLASVNGQVLVARGGKLETVMNFEIDRNTTESILVDVDLTGVQLVALVTEQGNFGPYGDHLLWLDARIAKQ